MTKNRLRMTQNIYGFGPRQASLLATQEYNNEGQMTRQNYPAHYRDNPPGPAPGVIDMEYIYDASSNNGQIKEMKQRNGAAVVQHVSYTYDSLARLSNAKTLAGSSISWNLTFGMDGFGNLNSQTGAGPNWNQSANPANYRIATFGYDANGNTTSTAAPAPTTYEYDIENRLEKTTLPSGGGVEEYGYGVGNQRVWRKKVSGNYHEIYFYKVNGERLGEYEVRSIGLTQGEIGFFQLEQESAVPKGLQSNRDRLGNLMFSPATVYYPYGEEYSVTANDRDKFGTYHRDSTTGLDYAVNRYYSTQSARFLTADQGPPVAASPQSWNRYTYGWSDPVNSNDVDGLLPANVSFDGGWGRTGSSSTGIYDASPPCPPGASIQYSGFRGSQTNLQTLHDAFERATGIVDDWEYADSSGNRFALHFSDATAIQIGIDTFSGGLDIFFSTRRLKLANSGTIRRHWINTIT